MALAVKILPKKPSEVLLNLIKEIGQLGTKLVNVFETIKQKGREEGFTDNEIKGLLRTHLKGSLTIGQINWYLYEKDKINLRKQLTGSGQINGNKVIEQETKVAKLRSSAEIQEVQSVEEKEQGNITAVETARINVEEQEYDNESIEELKVIIKTQQQYISKLKDKIQEKQEIQKSHGQLRIKTSVSQLYRDVQILRNSSATYTNIIVDKDGYVKLEQT
jgi:hypothetical protein